MNRILMKDVVVMKLSRLQIGLISLNLIGVIAIVALLLARQQNKVPLSRQETPSTVATTSVSTSSEKQQIPDKTKLMPHRNHNYAAAEYAYDVETIQAYLKGDKPYNGSPLAFITIDDGANTEITPKILDILAQHDIHATFFPIGSEVTPDKAGLYRKEIHDGHAIGLHSYSHDIDLLYPNRLPNTEQIIFEAKQADKAFKRILGLKFQTRVWRYPGGALSWKGLENTHKALSELGLTWIDWNASLGDAEPTYRRPKTVEEMIAFHTRSLESFPNSPSHLKVVLLHDAKDKTLTLEALPHIIQYYKNNGYQFGVLY